MGTIRKILLITDGLFVAFLSILALRFVSAIVYGAFDTSETLKASAALVVALLILAALVSGWRLFIWLLLGGPERNVMVWRGWWYISGFSVSCCLAATVLVMAGVNIHPLLKTLLFGCLFMIPFAHLVIECKIQMLTKPSKNAR